MEKQLLDPEQIQHVEENTLNIPLSEEEALGPTLPEHHHHMSKETRHKVDVRKWLADNWKDPALKVSTTFNLSSIIRYNTYTEKKDFLSQLKDHLLSCLVDSEDDDDGSFSNKDHLSLTLVNNWIYRHKVLQVNYTTYNMRRAQDSLNLQTHGDIMVLSRDGNGAHPYWYGHIIGIFHSMVVHTGPKSRLWEPMKMKFLFVRWFGLDTEDSERGGWKAKKLHQIGFVEGNAVFGFVDPSDVIRAIHLIPRFSQGCTKDSLGHSIARSILEKDEDWVRYYINM